MGTGRIPNPGVGDIPTGHPSPSDPSRGVCSPCPLSVTPEPHPAAVTSCRSPGGPRRKWLYRSAAPCRHTRLPTAPGPPRPPRPPPRGSPEDHPCVLLSVCPPGLSYPLFPAASLSRALATKTPPPLFLGTDGRRGESQGGVASGRSGGSAAVSLLSPKPHGCPQIPLLPPPGGGFGVQTLLGSPHFRSGRCTPPCRP